jgi:uncharacterized repeat protein (TIGR03803 family)
MTVWECGGDFFMIADPDGRSVMPRLNLGLQIRLGTNSIQEGVMKRTNGFSQAVPPVAALDQFEATTTTKSVQHRGLTFASSVLLAICAMTLSFAPKARADTVLHNFAGGSDGERALGTPVADEYGNLYGVTSVGGTYNDGVAWVLCVLGAAGPWPCNTAPPMTEYVLYSFEGATHGDGANPYSTLIWGGDYYGRAFTLYGTTYNGGNIDTCAKKGCGTVFELCAPSNFGGCGGVSAWQEHVLYSFTGGNDGANPFGGVITDKGQDLFGTTLYGGGMGTCKVGSSNDDCGTVFKLAGFTWAETILHRFKGAPSDGANPYAALCCTTDESYPYLYGTTFIGGARNLGTVFKIKNGGLYPVTLLHKFTGTPDGAKPYASVIFDASGNLYGTTSAGGVNRKGRAFELLGPALTTEVDLYDFCNVAACADGATPAAAMVFDSSGNLYGTTYDGGIAGCTGTCGTVFELTPAGPPWSEAVLWSFLGGTDGWNPFAGVIFDPPVSSTTLYGATRFGGSSSDGAVYSVP